MGKKIVLVACSGTKNPTDGQSVRAKDLYAGALFTKSMDYAKTLNPDEIFILSAKYGLLDPDDLIETYNNTLVNKTAQVKRDWSNAVLDKLKEICNLNNDTFIFLAGTAYYKYMVSSLNNVEIPLEGLRIGEKLQKLNELNNQ